MGINMEEYTKRIENFVNLGGVEGILFDELNEQNIIKCNTCSKCKPDFEIFIVAMCRHYICNDCLRDRIVESSNKGYNNYILCPAMKGFSNKSCDSMFTKRKAFEHFDKCQ